MWTSTSCSGVADKAFGLTKEFIGVLIGNDKLEEEGEAQQERATEELKALRKEIEAQRKEAVAEMHEQREKAAQRRNRPDDRRRNPWGPAHAGPTENKKETSNGSFRRSQGQGEGSGR